MWPVAYEGDAELLTWVGRVLRAVATVTPPVIRSAESWRRRGGELSERHAWLADGVVPRAPCRETLPHGREDRAEASDRATAVRHVGVVFRLVLRSAFQTMRVGRVLRAVP